MKFVSAAMFLSLLIVPVSAKDKLPFAAEVAIEEFEKDKADIEKKAADVIGKKRAETIAKLETEAKKLSKNSEAAAAAKVLESAKAMQATLLDVLKS